MNFIRGLFEKKREKNLSKRSSISSSSHHNLEAIYTRINLEYFQGKIEVPIKWFGSRIRKPQSYFRFGSYNLRTHVVKIHRMLDHSQVPEYVVAFILYHEMLHHVLPPLRLSTGRRRIHHPAFVLREKQFREYVLAQDFLKSIVKGKHHGRS